MKTKTLAGPITFTYLDQHRVHRHARCLNRMSEKELPPPQRRGVFRAATGWLNAPITGPMRVELADNVLFQAEIDAYHRKCWKALAVVLAVGSAAVTCLILAGAGL